MDKKFTANCRNLNSQKKAQRLLNSDNMSRFGFMLCATFSIFAVVAIIGYILFASIPALKEIGFFNFIFGSVWAPSKDFLPPSERFGIFPMIISSLAVTFGALLIGGTVGVLTAIFIVFFCPKKLKGIFGQIINLLAGIPSIIYGFFGLVVLVPMFGLTTKTGSGKGLLASSIILGIMILPTVASITRNALQSVPSSYYEGALALGATREQTIFKTVVPAAKSGIVTGLVLGIGRAIGETMAVMMVAGNSPLFPTGLFSNIRTLTSNIVLEMGYSQGTHRSALIATGLVLLIFVFILNLSLNFFKKSKMEKATAKSSSGKLAFLKKHVDTDTAPHTQSKSNFLTKMTASITESISASKLFGKKSSLADTNILDTNIATANNKTSQKEYDFYRRGTISKILKYISITIASIVALTLIFLIAFILIKGLPHITGNLLFGESGNAGMTLKPAFISTGLIILISLAIALPIGIGSAIFLVEYSKKGSKIVKTIRLFTDTLAGIPSIVFGLFGMIFFCTIFGGASILAGSLTMSLIILPTIIRSTEESLLTVSDSLREGSLALGASKIRTIFKVVLPSAISGILTAVVLSIGRIVGESAALIYTAGAVAYTPTGILDPGSSFAVMMWMFSTEGLYIDSAYATAAVLLIIVACLNGLIALIERKVKNGKSGVKQEKHSYIKDLFAKISEKHAKLRKHDISNNRHSSGKMRAVCNCASICNCTRYHSLTQIKTSKYCAEKYLHNQKNNLPHGGSNATCEK